VADDRSVEVVVLGKGVGESVLVRVGEEWTVIDSFEVDRIDGSGRAPAPLVYLQQVGVALADVRAVILSHLHADHSRGIDEVVRACGDAVFYLPAAVPDVTWRDIMKIAVPTENRKALDESATAYRYAADDDRFRTAASAMVIHQSTDSVRAVGPSDRAVQAAREPLAVNDLAAARRVLDKNFTSIVVLVVAGAAIALLGADMDAEAELGWPRLLGEHAGKSWIGGIGFVKVPHHGSETAYHADLYESWTAEALGVIAPNGSRLPTEAMIETLRGHVRALYLAGPRRRQPLRETDTVASSQVVAVRATHTGEDGAQWEIDGTLHGDQVL
jgi:beta-lactamase superfamily II metal-dependent hydrolase